MDLLVKDSISSFPIPPYIADGDPHLTRGDLRFEPRMALTAEGDGLDCIRSIIAAAPAHLVEGGALLLEHGYDQAEACRRLLIEAGFGRAFSRPDLAGIMRVSGGALEYSHKKLLIWKSGYIDWRIKSLENGTAFPYANLRVVF